MNPEYPCVRRLLSEAVRVFDRELRHKKRAHGPWKVVVSCIVQRARYSVLIGSDFAESVRQTRFMISSDQLSVSSPPHCFENCQDNDKRSVWL
jgi:hypothetical protein